MNRTLTGLAALILASCSLPTKETTVVKPQQGYSQTVKIGWDQLVENLRESAATNPFEDSWLYFPKTQTLVDVGEYSRIYRHKNKTKIVSNRNDERSKEYLDKDLGPAIALHLHPDTHLRENYPNPLPYRKKDLDYGKKITSPTSSNLRNIYGEFAKAKPSIADLRTMFNHTRMDSDLVSFAIVTTKGISFYVPKRLFEEKVSNELIYPILTQYSVTGTNDQFTIDSDSVRIDFSTDPTFIPDYLHQYIKK